jgi:hypothetical protein
VGGEGVTHVFGARWPWLFALYLSLAVICGYQSWSRITVGPNGEVWSTQTTVDLMMSGMSDNPIGTARFAILRSRVLVPLLMVEGERQLGIPPRVTHDAFRLLCIFAALLLLHWHFRTWFGPLESLAGALLVIASITITFNGTYPTTTEFPELVGMTACIALLVRGKWRWMLAALAIATLNRETAVLLVPIIVCLLFQGWRKLPPVLLVAGAAAVTWGLAYMLARQLGGVSGDWLQPPEGTSRGQGLLPEIVGVFLDVWPRRRDGFLSLLQNPHPYNVNWSFFLVFNVFWVLPLVYWRSLPTTFRRLYAGALLGAVPLFVFVGVLNEAGRHMVPFYPAVMPAGLFVLSRFIVPPAAPLLAPAAEAHAPQSVGSS